MRWRCKLRLSFVKHSSQLLLTQDNGGRYFLGTMYISYDLALALFFAFGVALWMLTRCRLDEVTGRCCLPCPSPPC